MLSVTAVGGGHHGGDKKKMSETLQLLTVKEEGVFSFVSEIDGFLVLLLQQLNTGTCGS